MFQLFLIVIDLTVNISFEILSLEWREKVNDLCNRVKFQSCSNDVFNQIMFLRGRSPFSPFVLTRT